MSTQHHNIGLFGAQFGALILAIGAYFSMANSILTLKQFLVRVALSKSLTLVLHMISTLVY